MAPSFHAFIAQCHPLLITDDLKVLLFFTHRLSSKKFPHNSAHRHFITHHEMALKTSLMLLTLLSLATHTLSCSCSLPLPTFQQKLSLIPRRRIFRLIPLRLLHDTKTTATDQATFFKRQIFNEQKTYIVKVLTDYTRRDSKQKDLTGSTVALQVPANSAACGIKLEFEQLLVFATGPTVDEKIRRKVFQTNACAGNELWKDIDRSKLKGLVAWRRGSRTFDSPRRRRRRRRRSVYN